ncbi:Replication protein A 32 kDa subunit B [Raphanus sativus]|uniref:Replication protein A 32 kDa subunit B n=1 Tax=Raphanus sativus TaxID=3726 RepID=A0A6J0JHN4_RAPSA|nr:replication protein A 32 kDa subunit B [Raphanus sativus]KAJ4886288.1 Replication protein A 32 kDa subunit B [Raphanus sativus]
MYGGEFDGNAAFAGGGFMPSQSTTQAPESSSAFRNRDARTLLPLTLKQLNSVSTSGESNFSIDGVDINTVAIVGRVSRIENRITQVDFVVDDGTGCVECIRWCHERQETEEMEAVRLGMYVRLHGHLKSFQGKRSMNVFSVRPVTDFNEVVHHFTECIYVHMYNTKPRGGSVTQATETPRPQMPYSTTPTPARPFQTGPSNQFNDPMHGVRQTVLNYLNRPMHLRSEAGVHCDVIARDLGIPLPQVKDALEQLSNDGCVYSTSDETCFKSTANA